MRYDHQGNARRKKNRPKWVTDCPQEIEFKAKTKNMFPDRRIGI